MPTLHDALPQSEAERDQRREIWALQCKLAETRHALGVARGELDRVFVSRSWKLTGILRRAMDGLRRLSRPPAVVVPPALCSLADFYPALPRDDRPMLFVDVTELAIENLQGGIQHTVKGILSEWLLDAPRGWVVVPVQLTREGVYVSATGDLAHLFCPFNPDMAHRRIAPRRGDVFLGLDLLRDHAPVFREALANLRREHVRCEIVVYDLLPIDLSECVPDHINRSYVEWLEAVGDLATGVACISQTVAARFERWLSERGGRSDIRISSFRLGVPTPARAPLPRATRTPGVSFLMVGTVEPRKGYQDAVAAFEQLWASPEGADVTLTIVGRYGWGMPEFLRRLEAHPELGKRLKWLRQATDDDVHASYEAADALLFCSFGEGFGLPIVEAALHRLPMVLRDLPEFREVAGDGALFFDGRGSDSVRLAVLRWIELRRDGAAPLPRDDIAIGWQESARQLISAIDIASSAPLGAAS